MHGTSTTTREFSDELRQTVHDRVDSLAIGEPSRSNQLMMTRCVVRKCSRVVRTTELQGMTGYRIKLMEIATGDEER